MLKVSARTTPQIKDRKWGFALNGVQERDIVLTHVVVPSSEPIGLGQAIVVCNRNFRYPSQLLYIILWGGSGYGVVPPTGCYLYHFKTRE